MIRVLFFCFYASLGAAEIDDGAKNSLAALLRVMCNDKKCFS